MRFYSLPLLLAALLAPQATRALPVTALAATILPEKRTESAATPGAYGAYGKPQVDYSVDKRAETAATSGAYGAYNSYQANDAEKRAENAATPGAYGAYGKPQKDYSVDKRSKDAVSGAYGAYKSYEAQENAAEKRS